MFSSVFFLWVSFLFTQVDLWIRIFSSLRFSPATCFVRERRGLLAGWYTNEQSWQCHQPSGSLVASPVVLCQQHASCCVKLPLESTHVNACFPVHLWSNTFFCVVLLDRTSRYDLVIPWITMFWASFVQILGPSILSQFHLSRNQWILGPNQCLWTMVNHEARWCDEFDYRSFYVQNLTDMKKNMPYMTLWHVFFSHIKRDFFF